MKKLGLACVTMTHEIPEPIQLEFKLVKTKEGFLSFLSSLVDTSTTRNVSSFFLF